MRLSLTLLFYSLMHLQSAWGGDVALKIGMHDLRATIASTPNSRERGLMQVTNLCENCGMLFVFPEPGKHSFWMKNTPRPLSIAFITADGHILNIDEMQAYSAQVHVAQGNALYALEMNKGWFNKRSIQPNALVQGLQQLPKGR